MSLNRPKDRAAAPSPGFTLVELIVTMVVAAIILSIAVPALQAVIQQNRIVTQVDQFVGDLNFARSEAITRGGPVTVCKSADGATCTTSGSWEQGWIVFTDPNNIGVVDAGAGETILRVRGPLEQGATLVSGGMDKDHVSYAGTGFGQGGPINDTFTLTIGTHSMQIIISYTGRVRISGNP